MKRITSRKPQTNRAKTKVKPKWKLVEGFPISAYRCGARAGDRVRLRKTLAIRDHQGKPTGKVHDAGGIWQVVKGAAEEPRVLWLRDSLGQSHTWDDDKTFWDWFERS